MITIDTSSLAHFFTSKNHIWPSSILMLHLRLILKCILFHCFCIFIKPLNVSNVLYPSPSRLYLHHNLLHLTFFSNSLACTEGVCPLRCSTIIPMLSLKVNHKCLINTIVPIICIIWLGFASTSKWYRGILYPCNVDADNI